MPDNIETPENPTMGQPKEGDKGTPELDQNDLNDLLTTLGEINVQSKDDLIGMHKASQETGQLANMLGEVRNEVAILRQENQQLRSAPAQNYNQDYGDMSALDQGQPIDFEASMKKVVHQVIDERDRVAHQRSALKYQSYEQATKHPLFKKVKPILDKRLQEDPALRMQLDAGQRGYYDVYRDEVERFQANLLTRTHDTIKKMTGQSVTAPDNQPPHMESGTPSPVSQNLVNENEGPELPGDKIMKLAQEKVSKKGVDGGYLTDEEELALIQAQLSDLPV